MRAPDVPPAGSVLKSGSSGSTINPYGMLTVADFTQIDGGSGPPSDASGSDETTLDVEQAGGVAPAAKIIVYEAPNTLQGWIDAMPLRWTTTQRTPYPRVGSIGSSSTRKTTR